ncbi:MAG: EamA family transporter [Bacteroidetes bacterium]|nr:EamA family transporter [Bacteroidota bacterium]
MLTEQETFLRGKTKNNNYTKAILALISVCFFWGTTWVASRQGVKYMPPLQLASIRQTLAGLCYILFFTFKKKAWPKGKQWNTVLILSLLNFFLTNGLTTWGVKYISAGLASIIAAIFPLWLVVIDIVWKRTKIETKALIGFLVGFGGICIIFYDHLKDFFNADFRFGIIISFIASLSWALGTIYTKQQANEFNPYFSIGLQMFISGIALFCTTSATGIAIPFHQIPAQSWFAIGYLIVFGSVISFFTYLYALQNLPTEQVSIYAYMNPVVAVIISALIFREPFTIYMIIGGLTTLLGVYMINEAFRKEKSEGEQ